MSDLEQVVTEYVENQPPRDEPSEQQQAPEQQPQDVPEPSEAETRARVQGWVPKDEFRGDEAQWRTAEEFLEVGEQNANVARERSRALEAKVERLERERQEEQQKWQERFERLDKTNQIALERQRAQIAADYEAQKRTAAELGDIDKYDQLGRDQVEALLNYDESVKVEAPEQQAQPNGQPTFPPEIQKKLVDWVDANPWMKRDPVMAAAADKYYEQLEKDRPGLTIDELLNETSSFVRKTWPDKFARPSAPPAPSAVEGGGGRQTNASGGKMGAANLPAEARKAGEQFIADGLFKDMNEYATAYFAEDNV